MRALLLLASLVFVAQTAHAQTPQQWQVTDPLGDVNFMVTDEDDYVAGAGVVGFDFVDLTSIWLGNENESSVTLGIDLAAFSTPLATVGPNLFERHVIAHFEVGTVVYRARLEGFECGAFVEQRWGEAWAEKGCFPVTESEDPPRLEVHLQKRVLRSEEGIPLGPSVGLSNIVVETMTFEAQIGDTYSASRDRVPDTGQGEQYLPTVGPGLTLEVAGPSSRTVAPGTITKLGFYLNNSAQEEVEVRLEFGGRLGPMARIDRGAVLVLPPASATTFTLSIDVPPGAEPGSASEIVVRAENDSSGWAALQRVEFSFDPEAPDPVGDGFAAAERGTKSPSTGPMIVVFVLVGALLVARRRSF